MLHAVALSILNCCRGLKAEVELGVAGMYQRFRNRRVDGQDVDRRSKCEAVGMHLACDREANDVWSAIERQGPGTKQ